MAALNLSVTIDPKSGFCFGVVEAIQKAEKSLISDAELYCLGEIVHNDEEVARLESLGMKTINKEALSTIKNKKILFRAHGEPPISYQTALKNNNIIIDASCPIIKKLQERIKKSYQQGETIVIYGKPDHPEVIGLNGQINNSAIIVQNVEELNFNQLPKQITLYSQTTKSLEGFYQIIEALTQQGKQVNVKDTICRQVSNRQPDIKEFCKNVDRVVFVAGKQSANGKVLYNACKSTNPNTYFVSTVEEIDKNWFLPNENIGISGATSTPRWLMENMKQYLESL